MSDTSTHDGGCLCGAVRYRARGAPAFVVVCTCTQCMRQTGSPVPTFASYPLERFELTQGRPRSFRASEHVARQFCGECGSFLFWRGDGRGRIGITLGSFDEPSAQPAPTTHIWAKHAVPWIRGLAFEHVHEEMS